MGGAIALHVVLFALLAVFVVPFVWVLETSIKPDAENIAIPPKWYPVAMTAKEYATAKAEGDLTPFQETYGFPPTFRHYVRAFKDYPILTWVRNTLLIVVFSVVGTLISCTMAGYAFARLRWPDRKLFFAIILGTMMLPFQVTIIPMFVLFRTLHWIDTPLPLIVPAFFGSAFFIFLLRQFFAGLPEELMEAARIDGASELYILTRIVVPLSKPALLTVAIFGSMWAWNDFLGPLIYLSSESQKTLALGLQSMVSQYGSEWGMFMASATVMIIPILILFFFAQRYFIEGIALTGLKG
jgi:multiple sugar transport system permease protein